LRLDCHFLELSGVLVGTVDRLFTTDAKDAPSKVELMSKLRSHPH
jgi:hypothetical protein